MREAVLKLLKGNAADLVRNKGPHIKVEGTLSKLETVYRKVAPFSILMQSFCKITQVQNEKIPVYTTRIAGALNKIRLKYPDQLDSAAIENHLREQSFHGMKSGTRQ